MSTLDNGQGPLNGGAPKSASRDHEIGYCRPPRAHQFKPGQSGLPTGRPKGAKNESTILREIMNRKITIREGDKTRKVSILEGILTVFAQDSLKGNVKSAAFLLNRYGAMVSGEVESTGIDDDGRAVLEEFARKLRAENTTKTDNT